MHGSPSDGLGFSRRAPKITLCSKSGLVPMPNVYLIQGWVRIRMWDRALEWAERCVEILHPYDASSWSFWVRYNKPLLGTLIGCTLQYLSHVFTYSLFTYSRWPWNKKPPRDQQNNLTILDRKSPRTDGHTRTTSAYPFSKHTPEVTPYWAWWRKWYLLQFVGLCPQQLLGAAHPEFTENGVGFWVCSVYSIKQKAKKKGRDNFESWGKITCRNRNGNPRYRDSVLSAIS